MSDWRNRKAVGRPQTFFHRYRQATLREYKNYYKRLKWKMCLGKCGTSRTTKVQISLPDPYFHPWDRRWLRDRLWMGSETYEAELGTGSL